MAENKVTVPRLVPEPELQKEAKALLAARLALLKASAPEAQASADQSSKDTLIKAVTTTFGAGVNEAAIDKLVDEYKKYTANQQKQQERRDAIQGIDKLLKERWNQIAHTQPSGPLETLLEQHLSDLRSQLKEKNKTVEGITAEIEWSEEELKEIREGPAEDEAPAAQQAQRGQEQKAAR